MMKTTMAPDYRLGYACSTLSSETLSGSCGSRSNRVRTVRLARRGAPARAPLGFALRGGHEHGTGFFVSHVEPDSEAHAQGLRVGDQIIRINGFTIEDAVHKEVLQLISTHTHLTLKVRSVGMIPVKDKKTDLLSWQIISDTPSSSRSSPQFGEKNCDIRINIMVAPRSKLGCGICKGPEWKPGIFIQFTKEGGIAREAGLRPGDQILQCNNVDFLDIPFNEAVGIMKNSRQLDLVIRKASSAELFPGESSGYNSSSSSVTEDQSPSWADSKRLSMVKEENQCLSSHFKERLAQRVSDSVSTKWSLCEWNEEPIEKNIFKPTIINLSENGTTIRNNGSECQTIFSEDDSQIENNGSNLKGLPKVDKKTIVEVHRSDDVENNDTPNRLMKSPSNSSLTSKASFTSAASSSLSSAISMEIQRRVKNKTEKPQDVPIDEQIHKKKLLRSISTDQQFQHSKLMNEFKQAHQKMFKPNGEVNTLKQEAPVPEREIMERLAHEELSQKLSDKLLSLASTSLQDDRIPKNAPAPPPPPPPPQSTSEVGRTTPQSSTNSSSTLKPNKIKPKAPPVPSKNSTLSFRLPPPCPTPDYDTMSLSSSSSTMKPSQKREESVEMDSLDSFKIQHAPPKPPCTYFPKKPLVAQLSNSSADSKAVSLTIGEYGTMRSSPRRMNFLRKEASESGRWENSLANELTHTLNRSNLRKRTESMDDLLSSPQMNSQSNGTIRISVSSLSRGFAKSTNDLTDDFENTSSSRTMINQGKQSYG